MIGPPCWQPAGREGRRMMTAGNSARLLEAAQTCFVSPFPAPAWRQPAGRGSPRTRFPAPHSRVRPQPALQSRCQPQPLLTGCGTKWGASALAKKRVLPNRAGTGQRSASACRGNSASLPERELPTSLRFSVGKAHSLPVVSGCGKGLFS